VINLEKKINRNDITNYYLLSSFINSKQQKKENTYEESTLIKFSVFILLMQLIKTNDILWRWLIKFWMKYLENLLKVWNFSKDSCL
jgi:hypothetical protein